MVADCKGIVVLIFGATDGQTNGNSDALNGDPCVIEWTARDDNNNGELNAHVAMTSTNKTERGERRLLFMVEAATNASEDPLLLSPYS